MPSVLGEGGLLIVTPVMVTFSQNSGLMVQKGELRMEMPSTWTFLQYMVWMKGGRRKPLFHLFGIIG